MIDVGAWVYVGAFTLSLSLSLLLTPLALRFALRRKILDHPISYKTQPSPIPYLGGVAITGSFAMVMIVAALIGSSDAAGELVTILVVALVLSLVGLIDDLRGLHPAARLAVEVSAAGVMYAVGVQVMVFDQAVVDGLLTVLWIVGIVNAFNLLDNMDGLSAGVATIASASFFVIALLNGQFLVAALSSALAGCAIGFLRHNFHPARIYMGDAGSLFLGFLLAVIGIKLRFDAPVQVTFFVPIVVLGVAIIDTILVVVGRLAHGKNPFSGGRDHLSHRLVFIGIPVPAAVGLIYVAAAALGWLGVVLSRLDVATAYILMGLVVSTGAFVLVLLSMVPVYENSKRKRMMIQEVIEREREEPSEVSDHSRVGAN